MQEDIENQNRQHRQQQRRHDQSDIRRIRSVERLRRNRQRCLVEGISKKDTDQLQARTANNRGVNFTGDVSLINQMVEIEITEAFTFSLRGELVE